MERMRCRKVRTHAVQADARSMEALRQIGADEFQIAVVATGASIEASVLIAANLVDLGIPQIWAKAISASHGKILERIGVNHVIYPEREAGERIHDWNLVEQGLTEEEARQEASRCLRCDHFGFGTFRGGRNLEW